MRSAGSLSLVLLGVACARPSPYASHETSEPPPPPAIAAGDTTTGLTGAVDEETFKRLHERRTDDAPPLRGESVALGNEAAYLSLPSGQPPFPAIIVIHEWWGLNDHVRHWADRLAAAGYAALAVDLYAGQVASTPETAMALMKAVDDARARDTVRAAHAFLVGDPRVQAPRTGAIGWCFGGSWSLQAAIMLPELDAAVIYYGRLETDSEKLAPIAAPILGIFGNRDTGIPPESVDRFEAALAAAGKTHELHRFEADHGFANPSGARYDHAAAGQAWERVHAFLARTLR